MDGLSHLSGPLARPSQLAHSASTEDGIPLDLQLAVHYHAACTIQAVGILLRLPQNLVAETIVIYQRLWVGPGGASLVSTGAKDAAAASLYLVCKPGPYPLSPRQVLNTFFFVVTTQSTMQNGHVDGLPTYTQGQYQADRAALVKTESGILRTLGFRTHVALPHPLCVNHLQTLHALTASTGQDLARRALAHLNSALFSPQLVYLTHQPYALAVAAIYLSARELGVQLPDEQWWEVFDVDREELGFLVVAMTSMAGFAQDQQARLARKGAPPLTTEAIGIELGAD